jgi:hypothetical protein
LTKEDHDVGVDDRTTSTRLGEEVHPWVIARAASSNLSLFHLSADLHDEELFARLVGGSTTDALPDLERFERLSFVHKVPRALRHEKDTDTHDCREQERATENVAPIAGYGDLKVAVQSQCILIVEEEDDCVLQDVSIVLEEGEGTCCSYSKILLSGILDVGNTQFVPGP